MKICQRKTSFIKSFLAEEGGTELVELAFSSVLLFTVVFGIMDCSRAVYIDHYLAQAARDGVHYAMLRGGTWTSSCGGTSSSACTASNANISTFVSSVAIPGVAPANMTVNTTWPGTTPSGVTCSSGPANAQGCVVSVQVNYAFHFMMPFLPNLGWNMSSAAAAVIVQ